MEALPPPTGLASVEELAPYILSATNRISMPRIARKPKDAMKDMLAQYVADEGFDLSAPTHESVPGELRVPALDPDHMYTAAGLDIVVDEVFEPIWAAAENKGSADDAEYAKAARAGAAARALTAYKLAHNGDEPPEIDRNGRPKRKAAHQTVSYADSPTKRKRTTKPAETEVAEEGDGDVQSAKSDDQEKPEEESPAFSEKTTTTTKTSRKKAVKKPSAVKKAGKKRATNDAETTDGVEADSEAKDEETAGADEKADDIEKPIAVEPSTTNPDETETKKNVDPDKLSPEILASTNKKPSLKLHGPKKVDEAEAPGPDPTPRSKPRLILRAGLRSVQKATKPEHSGETTEDEV